MMKKNMIFLLPFHFHLMNLMNFFFIIFFSFDESDSDSDSESESEISFFFAFESFCKNDGLLSRCSPKLFGSFNGFFFGLLLISSGS